MLAILAYSRGRDRKLNAPSLTASEKQAWETGSPVSKSTNQSTNQLKENMRSRPSLKVLINQWFHSVRISSVLSRTRSRCFLFFSKKHNVEDYFIKSRTDYVQKFRYFQTLVMWKVHCKNRATLVPERFLWQTGDKNVYFCVYTWCFPNTVTALQSQLVFLLFLTSLRLKTLIQHMAFHS